MSMTALVSAFCRAYHSGRSGAKIFDDPYAARLLTPEESQQIGQHMAAGAAFFDPAFRGDETAALARVMDGFLSPAPLCRAAFAEECFTGSGTVQYLLLGAGYDTFACRHGGWAAAHGVYELDREEVLADKQARLAQAGIALPDTVRYAAADLSREDWPEALLAAGFSPEKPAFCGAMGLSYYLTGQAMAALLRRLAGLLAVGSRVAMDLPVGALPVQRALADGAGEAMQAVYDRETVETDAAACGLRVSRWLERQAVQQRYFDPYNALTPQSPMHAPENVALCLLEK